MVRSLDSELSSPASSPHPNHIVVFLRKTLTSTVPHSTQVYK